MRKINNYDLIFILDISFGEERIKEIIEKYKLYIQQNQGVILSSEVWGKKKLSYPISGKKDGFYIYFNIQCQPDIVSYITRESKLTEGVLRTSIIKCNK